MDYVIFFKTRDIVLKISKNIQLNIGNVLLNWNHVFPILIYNI